jgi:hypothetical protein
MPNTYTLPFSALNTAPFVDSIEDVTLSIPTVPEIGDAVARQTIDRTDVDESVVDALGDGVDLTDEVTADIVAEIESSLGIDVPGQGSLIDETVSAIQSEISDGDIDVPEVGQVDDIVRQAVQEEIDLDDQSQVGVSFEGVFGPLSSDIADALEEVINFDPDDLPTVDGLTEELEEVVDDALDGLSPDVNGVEFWSDPIEFLVELVVESIERGTGPEVDRKLTELEETLEQ